MRSDGRSNSALRRVTIERNCVKHAEGSVLISYGDTRVLCTATIENGVPLFLRDTGKGWVTAEYAMLPRSAETRVARDAVKKGRALEISRLIGRALRCAVDLDALGERQVILDCDVIQADGGTRTAAITGAYVALHDALAWLVREEFLDELPLRGQCAAVSVGLVNDEVRLDLTYEEDVAAGVDMNLVMRGDGAIIEIQGSAEGNAFPRAVLLEMLDLAEAGCNELFEIQRKALEI